MGIYAIYTKVWGYICEILIIEMYGVIHYNIPIPNKEKSETEVQGYDKS